MSTPDFRDNSNRIWLNNQWLEVFRMFGTGSLWAATEEVSSKIDAHDKARFRFDFGLERGAFVVKNIEVQCETRAHYSRTLGSSAYSTKATLTNSRHSRCIDFDYESYDSWLTVSREAWLAVAFLDVSIPLTCDSYIIAGRDYIEGPWDWIRGERYGRLIRPYFAYEKLVLVSIKSGVCELFEYSSKAATVRDILLTNARRDGVNWLPRGDYYWMPELLSGWSFWVKLSKNFSAMLELHAYSFHTRDRWDRG